MNRTFSLVAALDGKSGIGVGGQLPWRISADMAHFVELTRGSGPEENAVIMGRKTWDSIPERFRPLKQRRNIVLSRALGKIDGAHVAGSWEGALNETTSCKGIFVIGGAQIYGNAIAMEECSELHLTLVKGSYGCDVFFPEYERDFERVTASQEYVEGDFRFCFETWRRKS